MHIITSIFDIKENRKGDATMLFKDGTCAAHEMQKYVSFSMEPLWGGAKHRTRTEHGKFLVLTTSAVKPVHKSLKFHCTLGTLFYRTLSACFRYISSRVNT